MRLGSSKLKLLTVSDSIHVASFRYCSGSALLRSSIANVLNQLSAAAVANTVVRQ